MGYFTDFNSPKKKKKFSEWNNRIHEIPRSLPTYGILERVLTIEKVCGLKLQGDVPLIEKLVTELLNRALKESLIRREIKLFEDKYGTSYRIFYEKEFKKYY
jgi:hypothetical protein